MNDDIQRQRMTTQIEQGINDILGRFVGESVSPQVEDDTRKNVRDAVTSYMQWLAGDLGPSIGTGCDIEISTNNEPTRIRQGFMDVQFIPHTERGREFLENLHDME